MRCFSPICHWLRSIRKDELQQQGRDVNPLAGKCPRFQEVTMDVSGEVSPRERGFLSPWCPFKPSSLEDQCIKRTPINPDTQIVQEMGEMST